MTEVAVLRRNPNAHPFLFATGIECSYPTIPGPDGKKLRIDELAKTGHYDHWKEDFQLVVDIGVEYLRYGPPYYRVHLGPGKYDWSFVDEVFNEMHRLHITPIADLCHFGVPDWIGNFQNADWPEWFAEYAREFASRYDWVRFFTPVNEIFITANFSGQLGWWNECLASDKAFVTALRNAARANIRAEEEIIKVQPQALFIQSESSEYFHADEPKAMPRSAFLNERRFLSLDLCYGIDVSARMYEYLTDNGMTRDDYTWFIEHGSGIKPYCIMGNDYYASNEHLVPVGDAPIRPAGEMFGYYIITHQYFDRYHLPVMHTETNHRGREDAVHWLQKEWMQMVRLKQDGVPIIGFTWYSLLDQVDWDTALREDNGHVDHLGLFNLDREIQPVGEAYRKLVSLWRDILPMESLGLDLHMPGPGNRHSDRPRPVISSAARNLA